MPDILRTDAVIIGAGAVGLACARALAQSDRQVLVLEALGSFGSVTSARNSEVIHAGVNDAPGSLKARLCVEGRRALYAYCVARGIAHRRCEKLIVATAPRQVAVLESVKEVARANGVRDVTLLAGPCARALEPALRCVAALRSPSTGILDSHAFMTSLVADIESLGGHIVLRSPLLAGAVSAQGIELQVGGHEPARVLAQLVVNAAGLRATAVARQIEGLRAADIPETRLCKGNYFALAGAAPFSRLVYPVREPDGLGIHFTLDLAGRARFGPDVEWLPANSLEAIDYSVDATRAAAFQSAIRRYWPGLPDGALSPAYSGVRPKAFVGDEPGGDFRISGPAEHGIAGLVNLFGIESPGLTAALAIGDAVATALLGATGPAG
jgi:L-2-hydroxyglutarate oxidase LhgO